MFSSASPFVPTEAMNTSYQTRAEALWSVIGRWDAEGLTYAVLHGFERDQLGPELDFLVGRDHETRALSLAAEELRRRGYEIVWPPPLWGRRLVGFEHCNWLTAIAIHSVPGVRWRNVVLAEQPQVVEIRKGVETDLWASFANSVVAPLLAKGGTAAARLAREPVLDDEDNLVVSVALSAFAGEHLAEEVLAEYRGGNATAMDHLAIKLRKAVCRRGWRRHPWKSVRTCALQIRRHWLRRFYPCAPVVALVGPDGIGKSTVLDAIRTGPSSVFQELAIRHWRPGLLPPIADLLRGRWRDTANGLPAPPRRTPGHFQWVRMVYYWFDYALGWWFLDRADSALQRAVIYDRCVLDMIVDPMRFGLSTAGPGRWLWRLTAKPDVVVLLAAEPATIRSRKAEMTEAEIREQYGAWNTLRGEGLRIVRVNAAASVDEVVEQVRQVTIQAFLDKNRRPFPAGEKAL